MDTNAALPRNSAHKEVKCTLPAFLARITGCLWWSLKEASGTHIHRALDKAEELAENKPGLARVALRRVRIGHYDDRLKVYADIRNSILQFTNSVFQHTKDEDEGDAAEHECMFTPVFIPESLLEAQQGNTGPCNMVRITRRLHQIHRKVAGVKADRFALLYMVGIFLFHDLVEEAEDPLMAVPIGGDSELDCDAPMDSFDNFIEFENFFYSIQHKDPETSAPASHAEALRVGVQHMKAKGKKAASAKKKTEKLKAAKQFYAILEKTPLDLEDSEFDWLREAAESPTA